MPRRGSPQTGSPVRDSSGEDDCLQKLGELIASMQSRLAVVKTRTEREIIPREELAAAHGLFAQNSTRCRVLCEDLVAECDSTDEQAIKGSREYGKAGGGQGRMGSSSDEGTAMAGHARNDGGTALKRKAHVRRMSSPENGDVRNGVREAGKRPCTNKQATNHARVSAIQDWKECLDELAAAHKLCLTNTYKRYQQFATPGNLDALFADSEAGKRLGSGSLRNPRALKCMQGQQGQPGVWTKRDAQIQDYEQVVGELGKITVLLQSLDVRISSNRVLKEIIIAPRGDAVLEFANTAMEWDPVLRFRVSSHMIAETSPIFAAMFSMHGEQGSSHPSLWEPHKEGIEEDILPPPPTPFICRDGTRTLLYRMPQLETDKESALTILLHAAHMHNDRVPREVSFEQFVALAEASLRYKCTSPLEIFVEHRWLPQWVHKATDAMPDGLVVISYAFGLRRLFTRVTKTAILNLVDEQELATKEWPKGIKERIWAVRCAKMAQVYQTCARALEEFLVGPVSVPLSTTSSRSLDRRATNQSSTPVDTPLRPPSSYTALPQLPSIFSQSPTATILSTATPFPDPPRCPRSSHWCDATNLGWLMLLFNSLHILPSFINTSTVTLPQHPSPQRSLSQIVESLRAMASPPPSHAHTADHRSSSGSSVCDPAPAFRAAVNDVYNSVSGLTLYEIDGSRHGWALSARHAGEPQAVYRGRDGRVVPETAAAETIVGQEGETGEGGNVNVDELTAAMGGMELDGKTGSLTAAMGKMGISNSEEDREEGTRRLSPGDRALGNEAICLRILAGIDTFDDLQKAAAVNESMYAVYKRNEPELERGVIGADRRRTVMLLAGNTDGGDRVEEQRSRASLSPRVEGHLQRLIQREPKPPSLPPSSGADGQGGVPRDDYTSISSDASETDTGTETGLSAMGGSAIVNDTPTCHTGSLPTGPSSVRSHRSTLSRRSTARSHRSSHGVNPYFKMTEEEARRILWGEPSPPLSPLLSAPPVRAFTAVSLKYEEEGKFGASGGGLLVVEDKMLVVLGRKQLREDMDRRIGLL